MTTRKGRECDAAFLRSCSNTARIVADLPKRDAASGDRVVSLRPKPAVERQSGSRRATDEARLFDQGFAAMDSAADHKFAFNEAVSYSVECEDQAEVDRYWSALTADEGAESG